MTSKSIFILGIALSLVTIAITANRIENGDTNATSMYFIVFLVPALLLSTGNTLLLRSLAKMQNKLFKIVLSLLPIVILVLLSLKNNLTIPFIDGDVSFIAQVTSIALGITNVVWIVSLYYSQIKIKPHLTSK